MSLNSKESLLERLHQNKKLRDEFVASHISETLALQLRAMREDADLSQTELAEQLGTSQNAVSRLESPTYGKQSISTLKHIASFHDVALIVRFVPFSELMDWVVGLSVESIAVKSFEKEFGSAPYFEEAADTLDDTRQDDLAHGKLEHALPQILKEQTRRETPLSLFWETLKPNISPNLGRSGVLSNVISPATGSLSAAGRAPISVQKETSAEESLRPKKAA